MKCLLGRLDSSACLARHARSGELMRDLWKSPTTRVFLIFKASSNKCHATSNRCLTSSNKKLLETSATLLVTGALLVVTRSY